MSKILTPIFGKYSDAAKWGLASLAVLIVVFSAGGINQAGYRQVIQYPWGSTSVKFEPGIYFNWFGPTWEYKDAITYSFNKGEDSRGASVTTPPISVRYQDGGTGGVIGNVRVILPSDEKNMLALHKEFRSHDSVSNNLVKTTIEQAMNLTAGLMSSEESYAEKRETFGSWAELQAKEGTFQTVQVEKRQVVEGNEEKIEWVPTIKYSKATGQPLHNTSPFKRYGITVSQFQVTDWDYEQKTLKQINDKREATMGIITAKANAERARWEKEQITAEGEKEVERVRLTKEQEKIQAVVDAEQKEEVAIIAARQEVEVNKQNKLAAAEDVEAAKLQAQAIETRSRAEADAKKRMMVADGALDKKLNTYERVSQMYANAMAQQKWVPDVQMGASSGQGGAASTMIDALTVKTLKDLSLDMSVPSGR